MGKIKRLLFNAFISVMAFIGGLIYFVMFVSLLGVVGLIMWTVMIIGIIIDWIKKFGEKK